MNQSPDAEPRTHGLMTDPDRRKPDFIAEPDMDKLVSVVMRLAMEVSVLRERVETHELLAARHGLYTRDDVDAFQPDQAEQKRRAQERAAFVEKIVHDLT
ncbi:MAG: hypothetical protein AAGL49_11165 [Pseudomonadota bacterium]